MVAKRQAGGVRGARLEVMLPSWMALVVLSVLLWGRLAELSPILLEIVVLAVIILPAVPMLSWSIMATVRRPRTAWLAPAAFVAFCAVFVFGLEGLMRAGAYLNFLSHRLAYHRIVADAQAGRLPLTKGRRYGADYEVGPRNAANKFEVFFDWGERYGFAGVVYSETECPRVEAPAESPPPPTQAPRGPNDAAPPTIKNAGRLPGPWWRLEGHYCFTRIVM